MIFLNCHFHLKSVAGVHAFCWIIQLGQDEFNLEWFINFTNCSFIFLGDLIFSSLLLFWPIESPRAKLDKVNEVLNKFLWIQKLFLAFSMFPRLKHLTYDLYNWLKVTPLSSTASVLKDDRILLEKHFFSKHQNEVILAISLLNSST